MPVIFRGERRSHGPSAIAALTTGIGCIALGCTLILELASSRMRLLLRGRDVPDPSLIGNAPSKEKDRPVPVGL